MAAKITTSQMTALRLIAENSGRVVAWQRVGVENYLKINGNVEIGLLTKKLARTVVAEIRRTAGGEEYELEVWEITEAGRAALAA